MVVSPIDTSLQISRAYGGPPALPAAPLVFTQIYSTINPQPSSVTAVAPVERSTASAQQLGHFIDTFA